MKYFTISELIRSETALKHNLWNGATKEAEENLKALVDNVLDPLREAYGRPSSPPSQRPVAWAEALSSSDGSPSTIIRCEP